MMPTKLRSDICQNCRYYEVEPEFFDRTTFGYCNAYGGHTRILSQCGLLIQVRGCASWVGCG